MLRKIASVPFALVIVALLALPGCQASKRAPVLVGQVGVGVTDSIGRISDAAAQLQKAGTLPAAAALSLQEGLLQVNTALKPLPDILRALDAAQKAGEATTGDVEKALAILQAVSPQIATLLAGVPVNEATKQLITLVRTAQTTVTTVLLEVAKLRPQPEARIYESVAVA